MAIVIIILNKTHPVTPLSAIKQKGVPTRHTRRYWTYVQTKGCKIVGNCPSDDIKLIEAIHDKGVTFWTSDSVVGNYNLDNACLS